MTRMQEAQQQHLDVQREDCGAIGEIYRGGVRQNADVWFVPQSYSAVVRQEQDTGTASKFHVWLVGFDQVPSEPAEGTLYVIGGETYRVSRDDITDRRWQWWGHSKVARQVFTVLTGGTTE